MKFGTTAATFCNDYLFGTLSGSLTVPPSLLTHDVVQKLIADLKYGNIGVNTWGGWNYLAQTAGHWGAFPGEQLDNVQSGIGRVGNLIAIPGLEKFVMYANISGSNQSSLKSDLRKEQRLLEAVIKFSLNGSIMNLINLLSEVNGINLKAAATSAVTITMMSILVAVMVYYVMLYQK
jgi:hypothetical protein